MPLNPDRFKTVFVVEISLIIVCELVVGGPGALEVNSEILKPNLTSLYRSALDSRWVVVFTR